MMLRLDDTVKLLDGEQGILDQRIDQLSCEASITTTTSGRLEITSVCLFGGVCHTLLFFA